MVFTHQLIVKAEGSCGENAVQRFYSTVKFASSEDVVTYKVAKTCFRIHREMFSNQKIFNTLVESEKCFGRVGWANGYTKLDAVLSGCPTPDDLEYVVDSLHTMQKCGYIASEDMTKSWLVGDVKKNKPSYIQLLVKRRSLILHYLATLVPSAHQEVARQKLYYPGDCCAEYSVQKQQVQESDDEGVGVVCEGGDASWRQAMPVSVQLVMELVRDLQASLLDESVRMILKHAADKTVAEQSVYSILGTRVEWVKKRAKSEEVPEKPVGGTGQAPAVQDPAVGAGGSQGQEGSLPAKSGRPQTQQEQMEELCKEWQSHVRAQWKAQVSLLLLPETSAKISQMIRLTGAGKAEPVPGHKHRAWLIDPKVCGRLARRELKYAPCLTDAQVKKLLDSIAPSKQQP